MNDGPHIERFAVPFEYPVCFTRDAFGRGGAMLGQVIDRLKEGRRHRVAVYVDAGLAAAQADLLERIKDCFHRHDSAAGCLELCVGPTIVPGGEAAKSNWANVREVMWALGNVHLDRQSVVLAVGGGGMLDTVGFAASIVHRGLRLVRMPSTTLSQCDAGIGVKTGMNEHGQKNFVGTFAPPFAVINDFDLLNTLPQEHWISGVAEAFKVAIIKDAEFFEFLCSHAASLAGRDQQAMEHAVRHCAQLHLEHIAAGGDPFEMGSARPLDFGHWAAHKLETMSLFKLCHGYAVSIGIALDCYYAMRQALIDRRQFDRILSGLLACGLPVWSEHLSQRDQDGTLSVLEGLEQFREHLGGRLTVTLPRGIGSRVEVHQMDASAIEDGIKALKDRQTIKEG